MYNATPKTFKPLLSAKCPPKMTMEKFLSKLRFPVLATPKIDGIRCVTLSNGEGKVMAYTRSLKKIPNHYVRKQLELYCSPHLDGELTCGDNFQAVTSGIMSHFGEPQFTYYVFGCRIHEPWINYQEIVDCLSSVQGFPSFVKVLYPKLCTTLDQLLIYEEECLAQGAEGVMTREPHSTYKYGRSTLNEQILVAIKRFTDAEGEIIGFIEQFRNDNDALSDNLGYVKRSSAQEGMTPLDTLGAFVVRVINGELKGQELKIGTGIGLTANLRKRVWLTREQYMGKHIKFKYQAHGVKDKPRIPVFLGFRED